MMLKRSAKRVQESQDRIASLASDVADLMEGGGPEPYLTEYLNFLHEIKQSEQPHNTMMGKLLSDLSPVNEGKIPISQKFPRKRVQIAAMILQGQISKVKQNERSEQHEILSQMARESYIDAAGHFPDDKNICMPQFTEEADARRKNAAKQWSIYSKSDVTELYPFIIKPHLRVLDMTDNIKGIGSIILIISLAILIYFKYIRV